jgi:proline iminopeptidase
MERVHQLNGIPGNLIHGRRDVSGPVITPWKLHQCWEDSRLTVVEDEGHGGPESMAALVEAVEEIAAGLPRTDSRYITGTDIVI